MMKSAMVGRMKLFFFVLCVFFFFLWRATFA